MDLFSLYVLFSHFRPRDVTPGNTSFQTTSSVPLGTSRGLKWKNKTYKLKRSIENLGDSLRKKKFPRNFHEISVLLFSLFEFHPQGGKGKKTK